MSNTQKALNGGKWMTTSTIVSTVFQFLQVAVLARLLEPSAFGIVSVSTMIISFFSMFTNLGFNNSIIYKQESDKDILSSLYSLNLLLGLLIFIIVYASAPILASLYHENGLINIIKVSSLFFLIVYFGQIQSILMQKELRFHQLAAIDISASIIGLISTLTFAYQGYREYSLIYGQLITQLWKTLIQVYFGRDLFLPKFRIKYHEVKDHLRFGIYNLGDGIVGFLQSNSDNFLIGSMLGVKALGYYTLASQLAVYPITRLNPIVLQVAYPIVAKMREEAAEMKRAYIKILDFLAYINVPLLAGLFITSDTLVPLLYGANWNPTVGLIRILVLASFFMCLGHPLFTLAYSKGKPNLLFYLNIFTLIIKVPLVYLLGHMGQSTGVAWAFVMATFVNVVANFFIAQYLAGSFIKEFALKLLKTILFSAIMLLCVYLYKNFIGTQGLFDLVMQVLIGGTVFGVLTLKFKLSLLEIKQFKAKL